jgi:ATP-binding cassette subfamily A (ABC1) protein 3
MSYAQIDQPQVGSSLFLKSRYGVGYTLTLTTSAVAINSSATTATTPTTASTEAHDQTARISSLVSLHVAQASVLSNVGAELSFRLPLNQSSKFPALLEALDQTQRELGIVNYGLSVTTLEDVFVSNLVTATRSNACHSFNF